MQPSPAWIPLYRLGFGLFAPDEWRRNCDIEGTQPGYRPIFGVYEFFLLGFSLLTRDGRWRNLDAVVLYADLARSSLLVAEKSQQFSAEVYKVFLHCAAQVVRSEEGVVTAYDGDRIMAVYIGKRKNTQAVKTALKINYVVQHIINPAHEAVYATTPYKTTHAVGIDSSSILVARTGVRGDNDLVWVGTSANFAAKICTIREEGYSTYITPTVYNSIADEVKTAGNGNAMWESRTWNGKSIYRSSYWWRF